MLIEIPGILGKDQVNRLRQYLLTAQYNDGRLSAGDLASGVKNNLELPADEKVVELARIVHAGLVGNPTFNQFALPRRMTMPIFSRYDVGMEYGDHADVALMGIDTPDMATRTDLSLTLFLSDPDTYDGGELVARTLVGENRFKPAAGHVVVYPSHYLHHVTKVTRGVRLAAVAWVQSLIREDDRRELLYELNGVSENLAGQGIPRVDADVLFNSYHKLMRMWADT